ncbi:UNC-like C-terminal-domain-containing protein [Chiua virens]|nr:UNC-like C-terminal-domain-containing protein [Chiua virens]
MFSSLPRTLLALSLIRLAVLPVLAASSSTSFNNPFRVIAAVHRTQHPNPPLCCLKPLPTVNSPEGPEDVLLSFEEWKSKQHHAGSPTLPAKPGVEPSPSDTPRKTSIQSADVSFADTQLPPDPSNPASDDALPPYFRVPITDRFDYANLDCSARVHMSHKSAKSVSSILSSKKDKYMLSPCSADSQFVVVELCDDIRIDTVQLANFEFFSGVFKDLSVSVAKTYTGTDEGWTPAGTYRAKNVRGVQSFHLPTSLRDFYRYIRIDLHSHYGHEYYCPVSLLRVYGLTHLEEWKWEMWQAESLARLKDAATQPSSMAEQPEAGNTTGPKLGSNGGMNVSVTQLGTSKDLDVTSPSSPGIAASTPIHQVSSSHSHLPRSSVPILGEGTSISGLGDGEQPTGVLAVTEAISSLLSLSSPTAVISSTPPAVEQPHLHMHDSEIHASATHASPASNPSAPPSIQTPTQTQSSSHWTGESIYRTIMNRLTLLEANHSLYARYVEEQTAGVREVLRKLNEEVGRLESVSRMQAQMYQRTVHEWERQRLRLELEQGELLSRVNYLTDEVILEKRLGIAQLCLLLAVLVFIGLTRGAPSGQHPMPMQRSTREWGVRNLSFGSSTDAWNPLRRRSRSPAEQGSNTKAEKAPETDIHPLFPVLADDPSLHVTAPILQHAPKPFKLAAAPTTAALHRRAHPYPTAPFRTPTKPRPLIEPHTLPRAASIARSQSSSTSGQPHIRSPKRWARTAHLHEIKLFRERCGSGSGKRAGYKDRENEREGMGDVFHGSPRLVPKGKGKVRRPLTPLGMSGLEEAEADVWIDTDVDGDEEDVVSERVVVLNSPMRDVFG